VQAGVKRQRLIAQDEDLVEGEVCGRGISGTNVESRWMPGAISAICVSIVVRFWLLWGGSIQRVAQHRYRGGCGSRELRLCTTTSRGLHRARFENRHKGPHR